MTKKQSSDSSETIVYERHFHSEMAQSRIKKESGRA
jgi:hypothetical protein